MLMSTAKEKNDRYRNDPVFRAQSIARAKATHQRNLSSAAYRGAVQERKRIWSLKESIAAHRERISQLQERIARCVRRKEEFEFAFGQERAARKRAGKAMAACL